MSQYQNTVFTPTPLVLLSFN